MGADPEKSKVVIEYILFCLNVITWLVAVILIGICFWVRFDQDITNWVDKLQVSQFYIGLYILIVTSVILMATGFLSCVSTFSENTKLLTVNVIVQLSLFILGLIGTAVLMENGTFKSSIHDAIKNVMIGLIQQYPSYQPANQILATVQESIGCCGGEGYNDYFRFNRPLPSECRDSVRGNVHIYSCADSFSWILEERCDLIAGLAIVLCCKKMINAVLSAILIHLIAITE